MEGERWTKNLELVDANYYTQWINNEVLLYSTGSYIQYPVISHNRKNIKKNVYAYMYIHTCMYD